MTLSNAQARDVESLLHPYTNLKLLSETGPNILERGRGVFVYDGAGREYLEEQVASLGRVVKTARERLKPA